MGLCTALPRHEALALRALRPLRTQIRLLRCSTPVLSGHNRWSKIRHDKAKEDSLKSKARTILSHDIINASKYGGPDPNLNSQLAIAISNAKRGQLSKTSIEAAIARGQGKSASGLPLENVTIEAMLPHGVAAIIECQTEQKARVIQDVRSIIGKKGGNVTPTAFLFDRIGRTWFVAKDEVGADEVMDDAIEAGATDITMEEGKIVIDTDPTEVVSISKRLAEQLQLQIERTEIMFIPREESMVTLDDVQGAEVQTVLNLLDEEPSLQGLYVNIL